MMIERLSAAPDQSSLACMLHLAALSDDAAVFKRAVEVALNLFGEGRLPGLSGRRLPCDGRERLLADRGRSKEFRLRFSSQTTDRRCSPWAGGGVSALRRLEAFANTRRGGPACLPR